MSTKIRLLLVAVIAIAAAMALNFGRTGVDQPDAAASGPTPAGTSSSVARAVGPPTGVPRLVDLGAGKCVPCKAMAPILEQLARDYHGRLDVVFLDVWKDPEAGKSHNIAMIPTQIFYDGKGRELFRHEGFFSREEILATWSRLGFRLAGSAR